MGRQTERDRIAPPDGSAIPTDELQEIVSAWVNGQQAADSKP